MGTTEDEILSFNPSEPDHDRLQSFTRINGKLLGHMFQYEIIQGDTYDRVGNTYYVGLAIARWIYIFSNFLVNNIPLGSLVNVVVNSSCGTSSIDSNYGLFLTYIVLFVNWGYALAPSLQDYMTSSLVFNLL